MSRSYGPFHRKKSPTQDYETALLQRLSQELWGRAIKFGGLFPKVKAYEKPLCFGETEVGDCSNDYGVEFTTRVRPHQRTPSGTLIWSMDDGPCDGIRRVDDETIALSVSISKIHYPETEDGKSK